MIGMIGKIVRGNLQRDEGGAGIRVVAAGFFR
jgi:hypothetical protein